MSINNSCPCYPRYPRLPQAPQDPFVAPPPGEPPPLPEDLTEIPLTLLNADFELATSGHNSAPVDWDVSPAPNGFGCRSSNPTPYAGVYSGGARDVQEATAESTAIDLLAAGILATSIDTGQRRCNVAGKYWSNKDAGAFGFIFLTAAEVEISRVRSAFYADTGSTWADKNFWAQVPVSTRLLKVWIEMYRMAGDDLNAACDNLIVSFEDVI